MLCTDLRLLAQLTNAWPVSAILGTTVKIKMIPEIGYSLQIASSSLCSQEWPWTSDSLTCTHPLGLGLQCAPPHPVCSLAAEAKFSCTLGKHSVNWAVSQSELRLLPVILFRKGRYMFCLKRSEETIYMCMRAHAHTVKIKDPLRNYRRLGRSSMVECLSGMYKALCSPHP